VISLALILSQGGRMFGTWLWSTDRDTHPPMTATPECRVTVDMSSFEFILLHDSSFRRTTGKKKEVLP
jgi:hypothetical protein